MVGAPESGEVSAAVREWLAGQGYGAVTDDAPPERLSGGADFWVYGLRFAGPALPARWSAPLVARVPAAAARYEMLRQDSAVQCWAAAQGYPAPEVLAVLAPGEELPLPVQVMARVPGVPLIAAARGGEFLELLVRLGSVHAELHRLGSPPADACPGTVPDRWLRLTRRLANHGGGEQLAASLRAVDVIQDRLEVADPVLCHGDFHPGNVLVAPGGSALHVIDWTNPGVGDRHGDIARTLLWFEILLARAYHDSGPRFLRVWARSAATLTADAAGYTRGQGAE
jgi:aminoglycoside phosphotransferase (APT) family kinase protein